jgi:hypothetical protein
VSWHFQRGHAIWDGKARLGRNVIEVPPFAIVERLSARVAEREALHCSKLVLGN